MYLHILEDFTDERTIENDAFLINNLVCLFSKKEEFDIA